MDNYKARLLESTTIRDLRIYADTLDGKVYHYHDSPFVNPDTCNTPFCVHARNCSLFIVNCSFATSY